MTSLTDVLAFLAGSATRIPGIRGFCLFSAASVFVDYILQLTVFVALFTLDLRHKLRSTAARADQHRRPIEPTRSLHTRLILSRGGMAAVLCVSACVLALAAVGCSRFEMQFEYDWFITDGSHAREASDMNNRYFGSKETTWVGLYTKSADYYEHRDENGQPDSSLRVAAVRPRLVARLQLVDGVQRLASRTRPGRQLECFVCRGAPDLPRRRDGVGFSKKIVFGTNDRGETVVSASLIDTRWKISRTEGLAATKVRRMREARRLVRRVAPSLDPLVYNAGFIWIEGYAIVVRETLTSISIACATVLAVLIVLLGDFRAALLVGALVAFVCVATIGSIYWWGDALNMITSFFIVIAVGLSADVRPPPPSFRPRRPRRRPRLTSRTPFNTRPPTRRDANAQLLPSTSSAALSSTATSRPSSASPFAACARRTVSVFVMRCHTESGAMRSFPGLLFLPDDHPRPRALVRTRAVSRRPRALRPTPPRRRSETDCAGASFLRNSKVAYLVIRAWCA